MRRRLRGGGAHSLCGGNRALPRLACRWRAVAKGFGAAAAAGGRRRPRAPRGPLRGPQLRDLQGIAGAGMPMRAVPYRDSGLLPPLRRFSGGRVPAGFLVLGGASSPVPRCPIACCCPSSRFGHGGHGHSGLAWLWPCRHVSGSGSACPGGLPASWQPTAGAAVPSFASTDHRGRVGAPSELPVQQTGFLRKPMSLTLLTALLPPSRGGRAHERRSSPALGRRPSLAVRPDRSSRARQGSRMLWMRRARGGPDPPPPSRLRFGPYAALE